MFCHIFFLGLQDLIRSIPHGTRHPDRAVVPQVPPNLPHDHGNQIGAWKNVQVHVEIVNSLNKAHTAYLKKIIRIFVAAVKLLDHTEHQAKIPLDQGLPGLFAASPSLLKEHLGLLSGEDRQL